MSIKKEAIIYKVDEYFFYLRRVSNGYEYAVYDENFVLTHNGLHNADTTSPDLSDALDIILAGKLGTENFENPEIAEITDLEKFQERVTYFKDCDFPDFFISVTERDDYGYTSDLMLPLQTSTALGLFDKDVSVYLLYDDNTEIQINKREDININFRHIFGVKKSYWDLLKLQDHTKTTPKCPNDEVQASRNINFSNLTEDCYAIYQLKKTATV